MILIWKATLILSAGLATSFVLRRASASYRHFALLLTMASLLALPLLDRVMPASTNLPKALITINASAAATAAAAVPSFQWGYLWLAGSLLVLVRLGAGLWRLQSMTRAAQPGEVDGIAVHFGDSVPVPLAWSKILLPADARAWDPAVLRSVVLHEHCHTLRRDPLAEVLCTLACAMFWFHPLAWVAAAQLRREREQACDDRVLEFGVNPADYAQHMIDIARWMRPSYTPAPCAGEASHLETRVTAVLDGNRSRRRMSVAAAITAVVLCIGIIVPLASAQEGPYKVGGDVKPPKLSHHVEPKYTQEARDAKIAGTVVLSIVVTTEGIADQIKVVKGLDAGLDDNAVTAVSQWRFTPGTKAGKPVAVQATIEVNFKLL